MTIAKPGNPHGKKNEPVVEKITFMLDAETQDDLNFLRQKQGPNVRGRTSIVIREAIRVAARVSRSSRK